MNEVLCLLETRKWFLPSYFPTVSATSQLTTVPATLQTARYVSYPSGILGRIRVWNGGLNVQHFTTARLQRQRERGRQTRTSSEQILIHDVYQNQPPLDGGAIDDAYGYNGEASDITPETPDWIDFESSKDQTRRTGSGRKRSIRPGTIREVTRGGSNKLGDNLFYKVRNDLGQKGSDDFLGDIRDVSGDGSRTSFSDLGLHPALVEGLHNLEIFEPTNIQCQAIPLITQGKDCILSSPTGTGKTLSYLMPLLQRIYEFHDAVDSSRQNARSVDNPLSHIRPWVILSLRRDLCAQVIQSRS